MDGIQGVVRRFVRLAADGTWRHGPLVGERLDRACDVVGGRGAETSATHYHGRQTTAILSTVRRHRCLQCADDGADTRPFALLRSEATGCNSPPAHRLCPQCARRAFHAGEALPTSPPARYVQPLPEARQGDTGMAGAISRLVEVLKRIGSL